MEGYRLDFRFESGETLIKWIIVMFFGDVCCNLWEFL